MICSPGDEDRPMTFVMVKSGAISLLITATCSYTLGVEAVLQETFPFKGDMVCLTVFLSRLPSTRRACACGADNGHYRCGDVQSAQTPWALSLVEKMLSLDLYRRVSHGNYFIGSRTGMVN